MADYSDAYASQCGSCGAWSGHTPNCQSKEMKYSRSITAAKEDGFIAAEVRSSYNYNLPDKWKCLRGCGTIVWDREAHKKNVCREWNK